MLRWLPLHKGLRTEGLLPGRSQLHFQLRSWPALEWLPSLTLSIKLSWHVTYSYSISDWFGFPSWSSRAFCWLCSSSATAILVWFFCSLKKSSMSISFIMFWRLAALLSLSPSGRLFSASASSNSSWICLAIKAASASRSSFFNSFATNLEYSMRLSHYGNGGFGNVYFLALDEY